MRREKKQRKLSPGNLEIMKIIWDKGEATVTDVFDAINAKRKDKLRRTTIQVQMGRLEDYGWLTHKKEGRTFYYSAVAEKQKARRDILNDVKNRVFGGSHAELVKCLFEDETLTQEEIKELRTLLQKIGRE